MNGDPLSARYRSVSLPLDFCVDSREGPVACTPPLSGVRPFRGGQFESPGAKQDQCVAAWAVALSGEQARHVALIEPGVPGDLRLALAAQFRPVAVLLQERGETSINDSLCAGRAGVLPRTPWNIMIYST